MFLIIHEDGALQVVRNISEDIYQASDDGVIDIVNIGDDIKPTVYVDGKWMGINS